ncbi:Glycosyltransferase involved in cell wall bisynthesis [Dyadobacter sp. SG02]|uniref:glycosyltransferase family 2 protein n=1 Tax=Dyadobacter sp. SG02 TaxID=1855291 RepID=UPI0008D217B4|nr:glycosyltransferase [Dyadobacter sp. SG02]SEJ78961.1 Glycosyltransferase involved in cell wall bisynthesis [Dyadobacter sp. SG02]
MLVSVIIPNYNHAIYLEQRIESVLLQTYTNLEVIILDDLSTDNSTEVINRYRTDVRIKKVIINDVNSGSTFLQWQRGISEATGDLIWVAESDDWCEPTLLENLVPAFEMSSCTLSYCQSYCVDGNEIRWQSSSKFLQEYVDGKTFIRERMLMHNSIFNASMVVWRRTHFMKISSEFANYRFCGDWLFWIELCTVGDVFISGKCLNYFRKEGTDVSSVAYNTGYNFVEELTLADLLHRRGIMPREVLISSAQRRKELFEQRRSLFTNGVCEKVEDIYARIGL